MTMILGQHDARTVAQLERCVAAEPGARGVLCADGHVGYSMPIGGVVAYRQHVSPSGVGYDIACFAGDTCVFTLNGETPRLADITGRDDLYVLAATSTGEVVPARASCRLTRKDVAFVEVELDNGKVVRCTPEHRFMLRDGSFCEATKLMPGASLMPLYLAADKDGYVLVRNNATRRLVRLHWLVYHAGLVSLRLENAPGDELVIHHVDFCRTNNDPGNLRPMSKSSHDAFHAACRDKAHLNTPEFTSNRLAAIQRFWEVARLDSTFMRKRAQTARENSRKAPPAVRRARSAANGRRGREHLIRWNMNAETIRKARERARNQPPCRVCGATIGGTNSRYYHMLKRHLNETEACADNHRVIAVRPVSEREDAYCLSVPGYENFAIAAGVFVHNCGNLAVQTDVMARDVPASDWERWADEIQRRVNFGLGRINAERIDHPVLDAIAGAPMSEQRALARLAADQLGTVGSGNHYVDVLEDDVGLLWVAVHFGSRGFGHKTATGFMNVARGRAYADGHGEGEMDAPPLLLDLNAPGGQDYLAAMQLAGTYAAAGREAVVARVLAILGATALFTVHNHHNFAWRERHDGDSWLVVRKGATPAWPGQLGFVGGSMGDISVVLRGRDSAASRDLLYSTVHGAGRVMSRTAAAGKSRRVSRWKCQDHRRCAYTAAKGGHQQIDGGAAPRCPRCGHKLRLTPMVEQLRPGAVDFAAERAKLSAAGIVLRGAGADEAPPVYRPLRSVLDAHAETIEILHVLQPRVVVMAGNEEYDPYKD